MESLVSKILIIVPPPEAKLFVTLSALSFNSNAVSLIVFISASNLSTFSFEEFKVKFEEGDPVALKGTVTEYDKVLQISVTNINKATLDQYGKYGFIHENLIKKIEDKGLIYNKNDIIYLTESGMLLADSISAHLFLI